MHVTQWLGFTLLSQPIVKCILNNNLWYVLFEIKYTMPENGF